MTTSKATSDPYMRNSYHHGDLASELLKAAESELLENGIEAFSLRAVAKRAGVSHGAPAHHFKDVQGLLTALATIGFERFIEAQNRRRSRANSDPKSQLVASGLGYIDFAVENRALFRLMFSSEIPDRANGDFAEASHFSFDRLVDNIKNLVGSDPHADLLAMTDVVASWAMVHGLADLMISGRTERTMGFDDMSQSERDSVLADMMIRSIKR